MERGQVISQGKVRLAVRDDVGRVYSQDDTGRIYEVDSPQAASFVVTRPGKDDE